MVGHSFIEPEYLNVRSMLVVGMERDFVQTPSIKYRSTFAARRKVHLFFGPKLFVFVGCHCVAWLTLVSDPSRQTQSRVQVCRSHPKHEFHLTGSTHEFRHSRWPDLSSGTQARRPVLQKPSSSNGAV
jgi:hypothetical protein